MEDKERIKHVMKMYKDINKLDDMMFNTFSENKYDEFSQLAHPHLDDFIFLSLFGKTFGWFHENFNDSSSGVLWDCGFLPETLLEDIRFNKGVKRAYSHFKKIKKEMDNL